MLASITLLGERGRDNTFGLTAFAYTLGSTAAAAGLGLALGWVGAVVLGGTSVPARLGVLALLALVAAVVDGAGTHIPSWRRQVNEDWLVAYRGWVYGLGFGIQLGLGVVTIVTTASVYLVWTTTVLTASAPAGAAVGAAFGFARAVPVLAGARLRTPAAVGARGRALEAAAGRFRAVTVMAELVAATGAVLLLVGR
jgi:hypothetical protein